jgi:hypothetical protein
VGGRAGDDDATVEATEKPRWSLATPSFMVSSALWLPTPPREDQPPAGISNTYTAPWFVLSPSVW